MTPGDVRAEVVKLRFELALGSWRPTPGECEAATEAMKALKSLDTTLAEALIRGTWAAAGTDPWELSVEDGGSRLTRLMHDSAELLMAADGEDAEGREITHQNWRELLLASIEHRPPAERTSWLRGLLRRTPTADSPAG